MALATGVFAAYALGHLLQGISNCHPSPESRAEKQSKYKHIVRAARHSLNSQCGGSLDEHSLRDLIELAQAVVLDSGKTDMYDVLVYREGFYKGSCTGYILLAGAALYRALRGVSLVKVNGEVLLLTPAVFFFAAAFSALIAIVFYRRYVRFAGHRMRYLLNAVCLPVSGKEDKKTEVTATDSATAKEE